MEGKSINETAKELNISKSALRYYDKVDLVQPTRAENGYRTYQDWDFLMIKYILVLKYGEFNLEEIQLIMAFMRSDATEECFIKTEELIQTKKNEFQKKISYYQQMLAIFETIPDLKSVDTQTEQALNQYVERLYQELNEKGEL